MVGNSKVTFSDNGVTFGKSRKIVEPWDKVGTGGGGDNEIALAGEYLFTRNNAFGEAWRIPNGGRGTFSWDNGQKIYSGRPKCGITASHCGVLWAHNTAAEASAPKEIMPKKHKGFVLHEPQGKFTDAEYKSSGNLSVNWAPKEYSRYQNFVDEEFMHYSFSNHYEYIISKRDGGKVKDDRGAFITHWPSNTWYRVLPKGLWVNEPALWLTKGKSATPGGGSTNTLHPIRPATTPRQLMLPEEPFYNVQGRFYPSFSNTAPRGVLGINLLPGESQLRIIPSPNE